MVNALGLWQGSEINIAVEWPIRPLRGHIFIVYVKFYKYMTPEEANGL